MSEFYKLDVAEQQQRLEQLARKALELWDLGAGTELTLIKYRENAVFAVATEDGRFVLRVHRAGYHSDSALRSELQWMAALNREGIRTPEVIPAADGAMFKVVDVSEVPEPRQVDVLAWVQGEPLGSIEAGASGDAVSNYHIAGELMARLHNQAQHWEKPEGFTRQAWDLDGLLGEYPLWGCYWELEQLNHDQVELIQSAREKARVELEAFGYDRDRYGLIHGDFLPENLLLGDDGIRLIDFDDSGFGWHLFDIATSLFFLAEDANFEQIQRGFIDGYRTQRDLPDSHLDLLPTFFMVRGLAYLGWAHTRKETNTAKELTPMLIEGVCALATEYLADPAGQNG